MLEVTGLRATYGAVEAVREVSLRVAAGEVLAVLGPNGAGKSTLANAISGLHRSRTGAVVVDGTDVGAARTVAVVRSGVALVPQGRRVFGSCTVGEHIALIRAAGGPAPATLEEVLELFPRLRERWQVRAHQLSGGEQQMLAITRAVLLRPRVLVLDEPTEGLAPAIVTAVAGLVRLLRERGTAILLMEQPGPFATSVADRVAEMDRGRLSPSAVSATVAAPSDPGRGDQR
jgi:branched-chain amino acid transport system ATP-binding protein